MKKGISIFAGLIVIGMFFCQIAFAGSIMDKINAEKTLKVGVAPWKNFIMFNPKTSEYEGIIADDLRNFEKVTGIKVKIMKTTWGGMIAGLQAGKWDAIMNGLGATPKRSLAVSFTIPYGNYCEAALVNKKNNIKSFDDLDQPGNVIAVTAGTSAHELWKTQFKKAKIQTFADSMSCMLEVLQGRAQAFMSDSLIQSSRAKDHPESLEVFIPENTVWFFQAHALRYADADLQSFLNTYIRNMQSRGWYSELEKKWNMPEGWATGR
ncbi:MAG: transporter substrate-binding domain-containing protein [Deltaproteobacteria bacterium]|jgi:polar amino acid transport system substrate-binding protein|nr:transporter substrate-binding domain-containing protein [Deltaproteobacteria bacterium]